jgi:hypothetical protein
MVSSTISGISTSFITGFPHDLRAEHTGFSTRASTSFPQFIHRLVNGLYQHCEEPTGRANARPMTGSVTKQSSFAFSLDSMDCFAEPAPGGAGPQS